MKANITSSWRLLFELLFLFIRKVPVGLKGAEILGEFQKGMDCRGLHKLGRFATGEIPLPS